MNLTKVNKMAPVKEPYAVKKFLELTKERDVLVDNIQTAKGLLYSESYVKKLFNRLDVVDKKIAHNKPAFDKYQEDMEFFDKSREDYDHDRYKLYAKNGKEYLFAKDGKSVLGWSKTENRWVERSILPVDKTKGGSFYFNRVSVFGTAYYMHRIMWEAYHGAIPRGMAVHHIDGDVENNHIDNLELSTRADISKTTMDRSIAAGKIDFATIDRSKTMRKIRCVETGREFESIAAATEWLIRATGTKTKTSSIRRHISGHIDKQKYCTNPVKGYNFEVIND